jgi:hypothetical protein
VDDVMGPRISELERGEEREESWIRRVRFESIGA